MRHRRAVAGLCGAALFLAFGLTTASAPAGAQTPSMTPLPGSSAPAASSTPSAGPVAPTSPVDFEVALNPRDVAGAEAFATAVSTSTSPSYRAYLTPAQWEERFSPTGAQVAQVEAWLHQQGFTLDSVSGDRMAVSASGTAAQVEQAFDTTLANHVVRGQTLRLAERDLSVPSSLAGIVAGAVGINQTPATPDLNVDGPTTGAAPSAGTKPIAPPPGYRTPEPCSAYFGEKADSHQPPYGHGYGYPLPYVVCGYVPSQLRSAYGVASLVAKGKDGTGETVAIVDAYASPTLYSDAATYSGLNDHTHVLSKGRFREVLPKSFDDGGLCGASGWSEEQTLDVEAVHGMAPGAKIVYVGAKDCFTGLFDAVRKVVDDHLADVVTDSWGDNGGDLLDDAGTRASFDHTLIMAAGTGVSVLFASGDNGDEFATLGFASPDYPPSSPWDTAVGGTSLEVGADGAREQEFGWSTDHSYLCTSVLLGSTGCTKRTLGTWLPLSFDGGSGGGTSYDYLQPAYQAGIVPLALATRNSPVVGPTPTRVVPDISLDADPGTGFLVGETQAFPNGVYYDQYRIGGTSVASPLFAGIVAIADQVAGTSLGFLNPKLYPLHSSRSAIDDVVAAHEAAQSRVDYANSVSPSGGYLFTTRIIDYQGLETYCDGAGNCGTRKVVISTFKGYDDMTGLGSPGPGLVPALAKR